MNNAAKQIITGALMGAAVSIALFAAIILEAL